METSEETERRRLRDLIKEDARETRSQLGSSVHRTLSRPINLLFVVIGATLVFVIDYAAEKAMDAMLIDQPLQVAQLDAELKSTSAELKQSAVEIRSLIANIDPQSIADKQLRQRFEDLQARMSGLTSLVERASAQTDKIASISEALRADWERNRRVSDGRIDSVPDLVLTTGEAVSVCDRLATVGVVRITTDDGTAHLKTNDWTYWVNPGQRVPLEGGGTLSFIGLNDGAAHLKLECPG